MTLRYIQGMKDFGILYKRKNIFTVVGYSGVDFVGNIDYGTSTSCYFMTMGSTTVSWSCKNKAIVSNYLVEVDYILAWETSCEIVRLCKILQDLGITQKSTTTLLIDSQSTIKMVRNPIFH